MNVRTMRRVDRWLGMPMCAALTAIRRLAAPFARQDSRTPPRRIAVVKLTEQGATVLAYPALLSAAEQVGRENLFFVVFSPNRFILDLLDVVPRENVIAIRTDGLVRTVLDTLGAVLDYDKRHDGELIHTLEAFFIHNGNLARTAEMLCVHRNTLGYRLGRVSEITGMNLDDSDTRLMFHLALKVWRVVDWTS